MHCSLFSDHTPHIHTITNQRCVCQRHRSHLGTVTMGSNQTSFCFIHVLSDPVMSGERERVGREGRGRREYEYDNFASVHVCTLILPNQIKISDIAPCTHNHNLRVQGCTFNVTVLNLCFADHAIMHGLKAPRFISFINSIAGHAWFLGKNMIKFPVLTHVTICIHISLFTILKHVVADFSRVHCKNLYSYLW